MKKILFLIPLFAALSACASFWNFMGAASVDQDAQNKKDIAALQQQLASSKDTAAKVKDLEVLVQDLRTKYDTMPQETLRRIAEILNKAAAEAGTQAQKTPAPVAPVAPTTKPETP